MVCTVRTHLLTTCAGREYVLYIPKMEWNRMDASVSDPLSIRLMSIRRQFNDYSIAVQFLFS